MGLPGLRAADPGSGSRARQALEDVSEIEIRIVSVELGRLDQAHDVPMLKPGLGRTHRAYLWIYSSSEYDELAAVVYDFADSRSGAHAREFRGAWSGKLVCDDYSGYKALFERGVIEIGCMAHARRKFHDLYANHRSDIAAEALRLFAELYEIERQAREQKLDADRRKRCMVQVFRDQHLGQEPRGRDTFIDGWRRSSERVQCSDNDIPVRSTNMGGAAFSI